nr:VWA domain-containing protein [Cohnella sp. CFH 77786]
MRVEHSWALLLLIPCAVFIWWTFRGTLRLTGGRKAAAVSVRAAILLFLIAVVAGVMPYERTEMRNVVFVADRSASLNEDAKVSDWVRSAIDAKSAKDQAAVVSFGLNAAVERALSVEQPSSFALRTEVNRSFSNVAAGLQLGAGLLADGGRIVLLSDGEENAGDLLRQGRRLREMGIAVDVVDIPKQAKADAALESLRVPSSLKLGEKFSFELTVTSTFAGTAELRLYEDEAEKGRVAVQLEAGENRFALRSVAADPGLHRYRAEIYAEGDRQAQNNAAFAFSRVEGPPRVLVIEGAAGSSGNITSALSSSLIPYDVILPEQLSSELADYARYDSLIMNNVPATRVAEAPMRNLAAAVSDYGIGLVMIGGKDSYGLGGYFKTPVEKALPVYMDLKGKRQLPSLGLVLVIDKSGSMDGGKLELAKEAALRTVELMRDEDTVGVVAFDDSPWWVMEPVRLTEREKVMSAIQGIHPGGGTEIYSAVDAGLKSMLKVNAQRKHIILMTDGQSASNPGYSNLTAMMVQHDITMSTVAVGDGADASLLENLAKEAKGRYYFTNDQSTIPAIFSRETTMMSRTYIVENRFVPAVGSAGDWFLLFSEGVPAVDAYVATTPKETADSVLVSPMGDPLLARWQFGSGRTVAWTSDLTGQWAKDWIGWDQFPDIFAQWVKWTFPQFAGEPYEISAEWQGGEAELRIRESSGEGGAAGELKAIVSGDYGAKSEVSPLPIAPGEYAGRVPVDGPGVYLTQIGNSVTGFVIPYSPEYRLSDAGGKEKLAQLAATTGGRVLDPSRPEAAFEGPESVTKRYGDWTRPLLIATLLLWLLDIAIRRLSVPWGKLAAYARRFVPAASGSGTASTAGSSALSRLQQRKRTAGDFYSAGGSTGEQAHAHADAGSRAASMASTGHMAGRKSASGGLAETQASSSRNSAGAHTGTYGSTDSESAAASPPARRVGEAKTEDIGAPFGSSPERSSSPHKPKTSAPPLTAADSQSGGKADPASGAGTGSINRLLEAKKRKRL